MYIFRKSSFLAIFICSLLVSFACIGAENPGILNRAGKTPTQLATEFRTVLIGVDPKEVGSILLREIQANSTEKLDRQKGTLPQHLRDDAHFGFEHRSEHYLYGDLISLYRTVPRKEEEIDIIVSNLLDLLFSGRVSYSVGSLQDRGQNVNVGENADGFVVYANIEGHGIAGLASPSGMHVTLRPNYRYIYTDYLRIPLRFIIDGTMQLMIMTMFHENPESLDFTLPPVVQQLAEPPQPVAVQPPLPPGYWYYQPVLWQQPWWWYPPPPVVWWYPPPPPIVWQLVQE